MALLIDSSVFVTLERRGLSAPAANTLLGAEASAMASITASELLAGVYRAESPARKLQREAFVEGIIDAVPVLSFDLTVARIHGQLAAQLAMRSERIGAHDLIIGATALAHGYAVLTDNVRDFQRVPGLTVRTPDW